MRRGFAALAVLIAAAAANAQSSRYHISFDCGVAAKDSCAIMAFVPAADGRSFANFHQVGESSYGVLAQKRGILAQDWRDLPGANDETLAGIAGVARSEAFLASALSVLDEKLADGGATDRPDAQMARDLVAARLSALAGECAQFNAAARRKILNCARPPAQRGPRAELADVRRAGDPGRASRSAAASEAPAGQGGAAPAGGDAALGRAFDGTAAARPLNEPQPRPAAAAEQTPAPQQVAFAGLGPVAVSAPAPGNVLTAPHAVSSPEAAAPARTAESPRSRPLETSRAAPGAARAPAVDPRAAAAGAACALASLPQGARDAACELAGRSRDARLAHARAEAAIALLAGPSAQSLRAELEAVDRLPTAGERQRALRLWQQRADAAAAGTPAGAREARLRAAVTAASAGNDPAALAASQRELAEFYRRNPELLRWRDAQSAQRSAAIAAVSGAGQRPVFGADGELAAIALRPGRGGAIDLGPLVRSGELGARDARAFSSFLTPEFVSRSQFVRPPTIEIGPDGRRQLTYSVRAPPHGLASFVVAYDDQGAVVRRSRLHSSEGAFDHIEVYRGPTTIDGRPGWTSVDDYRTVVRSEADAERIGEFDDRARATSVTRSRWDPAQGRYVVTESRRPENDNVFDVASRETQWAFSHLSAVNGVVGAVGDVGTTIEHSVSAAVGNLSYVSGGRRDKEQAFYNLVTTWQRPDMARQPGAAATLMEDLRQELGPEFASRRALLVERYGRELRGSADPATAAEIDRGTLRVTDAELGQFLISGHAGVGLGGAATAFENQAREAHGAARAANIAGAVAVHGANFVSQMVGFQGLGELGELGRGAGAEGAAATEAAGGGARLSRLGRDLQELYFRSPVAAQAVDCARAASHRDAAAALDCGAQALAMAGTSRGEPREEPRISRGAVELTTRAERLAEHPDLAQSLLPQLSAERFTEHFADLRDGAGQPVPRELVELAAQHPEHRLEMLRQRGVPSEDIANAMRTAANAPARAPPPAELPPAQTPEQLAARFTADARTYGREPKVEQGARNEYAVEYRDPSRILAVDRSNSTALEAGQKFNYVILADGHMEVGRISPTGEEGGVKHVQIANRRPVVFSGTVRRGPDGRLVMDLDSGTFSHQGTDPRWEYTDQNKALLRDYAQTILGEPVEVVRPARSR